MNARILRFLGLSAVCLASAAVLRQSLSAEEREAAPAKPEVATTKSLGGEERYLTHLSTDKPVYKIGENVYLRGVVLDALGNTPLADDKQVNASLEIVGPKGDVVTSTMVRTEHSVIGFSWKVPEGQPGGEYTAKVTYPWEGHPPAERKFDVRVYRAPRMRTQIEFIRDGYGPGDTVSASLHVERAEGGIPAGSEVDVIGRVDGVEVFRGTTTVDPSGNCGTSFDLPSEIERGEGTLAFVVKDGGVFETATKTIPILLQTVDLQMFPEGGDLVAGLENRVYLQARTPAKKPADIAGVVLNADGETVGEFRTTHEGRGRFAFTPAKGESYALRITEPSGIKTRFPLPEVKPSGVVLSTPNEVVEPGAKLNLMIGSSADGEYTVTVAEREVELAHRTVDLSSDRLVRIKSDLPADAAGVLRVTVWDAKEKPVAERLVFRRPQSGVNVEITADRERYVPGGNVELTVKTTDETGKPIGAVVGLTVTDDSVLEMIEKREQAPRLPVMVLLEKETRDLADAHVYLDPENAEADEAVDLLLGTQGWRRFAFVDTAAFLAENGDDARRVLALKLPSQRELKRLERELRVLQFRGGGADLGGIPVPQAAAEFAPGAAIPVDGAEPAEAPPAGAEPQDDAAIAAVEPNAAIIAADPVPAAPPAEKPRLIADLRRPNAGEPAPVEKEQQQLAQALREAEAKVDADAIFADEEFNGRRRKRVAMVYVREYAHAVREGRQPGQRSDFTETLYWNAGVKTDAETGIATMSFGLSDSVTSFRAIADAFDGRGALGTGTSVVESVEPLYAEPKIPLEVTSGDVIDLPIGVVNATVDPLSEATLAANAEGVRVTGTAGFPRDIPADTRLRQIVGIDTTGFNGSTDVVLDLSAGGYADRVTRPLVVQPNGFPIEIGKGGMLDANSTIKRSIVMPGDIVPGSVKTSVRVFPSPLSSMTTALERLIREPNGCFEQTSSSTYPLVMAQQYFTTHSGVDPQLVARSNEMLEKGYNRLIGYECKQGGFEWFGADPGHEALTAYGLMEFSDMAQVRNVDTSMIDRTRSWLLGQRDGQGGFKRERRALHTWLADEDVSNAYITWALLAAGEDAKELSKEIDWVEKNAGETKNSYVLALGANVMIAAGRQEAARAMLDKLIQLQDRDGSIPGATTSIVGSGGEALTIEATSLATLAFTNDLDDIDFADKGVRYLTEVCKAGRFGSTQSTILALKAIVAFDAKLARPKAAGTLQLVVDGENVGEPVAFDRTTEGAIELPSLVGHLTPGEHEVAIGMTGGSTMPFVVSIDLHSTKPASSDECKVALDVTLVDGEVEEGGVTEARVVVENETDEVVPTPTAIVGIPGGLEVRHDQLKELVKSEKIAAYEVLGREVVLYWRGMEANQKVELPISLVAAVPGKYTAPASRAYLYYTDEHKQWEQPLDVTITPRAE